MNYTLHNIDLKRDEQNYICFSGWFLSKNPVTELQKQSLINFLKDDHENLHIKTFDGEGEDLYNYCNGFNYFDLNVIGESAVIILNINYVEEYDQTIGFHDFMLCTDDNKIVLFDKNGNTTNLDL